MAHDVFISYSSKDKPAADAACSKLEAEGIRCWVAPRDILPGQEWGAAIVKAIAEAKIFVLLLSASANTSPQISREVERAVYHGLPVIPVRLEDVKPTASLEYFINTPHWLDAFQPPLDQHFAYLARVVRTLMDGGDTPARPEMPPSAAPEAAPAAAHRATPPPAAAPRPASSPLLPILAVVVLLLVATVGGLAWLALRPHPPAPVVPQSVVAASSSQPLPAGPAVFGVTPAGGPVLDPACLMNAPSVPNPGNCNVILNQNQTWQGCAASFVQGDMGAQAQRAQSLISAGQSGVGLYDGSPEFRSYGAISHYWEMFSQCVHDGEIPFQEISGGIPFPEEFWNKTQPLRQVFTANWQGANQPLPDFMSNFRYLCEQYKAARESERPGGGASLDCSS